MRLPPAASEWARKKSRSCVMPRLRVRLMEVERAAVRHAEQGYDGHRAADRGSGENRAGRDVGRDARLARILEDEERKQCTGERRSSGKQEGRAPALGGHDGFDRGRGEGAGHHENEPEQAERPAEARRRCGIDGQRCARGVGVGVGVGVGKRLQDRSP